MDFFSVEGAPKRTAHYTPAVRSGNLVCISGQLPIDPMTGEHCKGNIAEQTKRVLENVNLLAHLAGAQKEEIMKVTIYISDIELWGEVNQIYADFFGDHKPARTIVPAPNLHYGFLIEMDAMAVIES